MIVPGSDAQIEKQMCLLDWGIKIQISLCPEKLYFPCRN
jgi:hypothetical protein